MAEISRWILHYGLHFIVPVFIALYFFKDNWFKVYLILLITMLIDLDHLLADPLFDPSRCSINFHPLHSYLAGLAYCFLLFFKKTRVWGIGLCLHLITDAIDCLWIG